MGVGQSGTFVANFCQSVLSGGEREEGMRACTGEKGSGVHSGMKSGNNDYTNGSSTQRYVCMLESHSQATWAGNETSAAWDEATILRVCFFSVT